MKHTRYLLTILRRPVGMVLLAIAYGIVRCAEIVCGKGPPETRTVFFSSAAKRRHEARVAETKPATTPDPDGVP